MYLCNRFILVTHDPIFSTIKKRITDFINFHKNVHNLIEIHEQFVQLVIQQLRQV